MPTSPACKLPHAPAVYAIYDIRHVYTWYMAMCFMVHRPLFNNTRSNAVAVLVFFGHARNVWCVVLLC
jgi:hypothetical protein